MAKFFSKRDENPIDNLITMQANTWDAQFKKGNSPYKQIKTFGSLLFQNYSQDMTGYHWLRYRTLKAKYSPTISYKNLDLNRCSIANMRKILFFTEKEAKDVWFSRPFDNIGQLYDHSSFQPSVLTNNKVAKSILELLSLNFVNAIEKDDPEILFRAAKNIKNIEFGRSKVKLKEQLSKEEWETVWFYYRILKTNLFNLNQKAFWDKKENTNVQNTGS